MLIFILILSSLITSGCWGFEDMNQKSILTSLILDKKDGQIIGYSEYVSADTSSSGNGNGDGGGGSSSQFYLLKAKGNTIAEARAASDLKLEKELYISAARALIFTEAFAKDYLVEYLNRARAYEVYRKKIITVITKDDPQKLFEAANKNGGSLGFKIDDLTDNLKNSGRLFIKPTGYLLENISSKYTGTLIPAIGITEGEVGIVGYFPVKDSTIGEMIPMDKARGITLLKAKKPKLTYTVPYEDIIYYIDVTLSQKKITPIYQNGKITCNVECKCKGVLMYADKKIPYGFTNTLNSKLSEKLREMIKYDIESAYWQAKNICKCDFLNCYDVFRVHYPQEIEKMDWAKEFPTTKHNIIINLMLEEDPMLDYSVKETK